jgi:hypothetical protein
MNYNLPPDEGKKKKELYWNVCIALGIISVIAFVTNYEVSHERSDSGGEIFSGICGWSMCCFSLIFAISALSTKNDTRRVVVVQQQPQYIPVVQQVIQQPSLPTRPNPPAAPIKNKTMWIADARNLELARNWEGAADAYQKAGMYEEAGRIRQEHLEQNQPVVQIGHVGNTVLNDSVMIAESTPKTCNSCGNVSEPSWKICPHCSNPL